MSVMRRSVAEAHFSSSMFDAMREAEATTNADFVRTGAGRALGRKILANRRETQAQIANVRRLREARWNAIAAGAFDPISTLETFTDNGTRETTRGRINPHALNPELNERRRVAAEQRQREQLEAEREPTDAELDGTLSEERKAA